MPSDGDANSGATAPSASIMASSFMCNVSLPPKLEIHSGKLSKEWKQWRQVWDAYEEVTDLRSKTRRLLVATFIPCTGKEALEIHNGLPFRSEEEKSDITKVLELWETHCLCKTNIIYERYKNRINRYVPDRFASSRQNLRIWNLERPSYPGQNCVWSLRGNYSQNLVLLSENVWISA